MSELKCRKCDSDLKMWNNMDDLWINHCPSCGTKLLKKQTDAIHRLTTDKEVSDKIRGKLLDTFNDFCSDVSADELAEMAWESENYDCVVFYSNYEADLFVRRHLYWVDSALEYVCNNYGADRYVEMKANCNDTFLVVAFIEATRIYLYNQLGINEDEGVLSAKRIKEIVCQIKETEYVGEW